MSEENQLDHKHTNINRQNPNAQLEDTPKGEEVVRTKEEEALEIHHQKKNPKIWNTIWADNPLDQVFLDLADMSKIKDKKGNKGYAWMLVWIDCHSRYLIIIPLKNKTAKEVYYALKSIPYKPKSITTDSGGEYKGATRDYFIQNGIKHDVVEVGDHRALAIVDRVIRSIRRWLDLLFETNRNFDWVSYIQDLVVAYNHKIHRTLQARPVDVFARRDKNKQKITRDYLIEDFEVGDSVRKENKRNVFSKGGKTFSKIIYKVKGRSGFKIVLNNDELVSPRDLLKTDFIKPIDEEKDIKEKTKEVIKEKKTKELLKREEIEPENIRTSKRERKAKVILDL